MSTLVHSIPYSYLDPEIEKGFFSKNEKEIIVYIERRRIAEEMKLPCSKPAYIGIFFDGTNNSYRHALENNTEEESNIARLYDVFPGYCVPGILPPYTDWKKNIDLYQRYFKIYVPGVGKAFPNIGDQTSDWVQTEWDSISGGAMATYGQGRILWGIAQLINYIYGYYYKGIGSAILITDEEVRLVSENVKLTYEELEKEISIDGDIKWARICWKIRSYTFSSTIPIVNLLKYSSLGSEANASLVLCHWLMRLRHSIGNAPKRQDVLPLNKLHLYTFGFSRGAAQARAYLNWLLRACRIDAALHQQQSGPLSLGGIEVSHDFMGIFDTVASVGWADMFSWSSGHDWWGDARSLHVPKEVGTCVHFVAAHEQRRCFPLDSVYQGQRLPDYCKEIVFPGAHSDVGGGYAPLDQGKGYSRDGTFTLSRIPLVEMYRAARIAGVPLVIENANKKAKNSYRIAVELIQNFNDYLELFPLKEGTTAQIVTPHWEKQLLQYFRRYSVDSNMYPQASARRAYSVDKELRDNVKKQRVEIKNEIYTYHIMSARMPDYSGKIKQAYFRQEQLNSSIDAIYTDRLETAERVHALAQSTMNAECEDFMLVKNNHYSELLSEEFISIEYSDPGRLKKSVSSTLEFIESIPGEIKQRIFDDVFVLKNPEKKELRYVINNVLSGYIELPAIIDNFIDNYIHDSVAGFIEASTLNERYWSRSFVYFRYRRIFSGSNTFYQVPYDEGFDCSREDQIKEARERLKRQKHEEEEEEFIGRQMGDQMSTNGGMFGF